MEQFKINPKKLSSIKCSLEEILEIVEVHGIYHDWAILYDIICNGAAAFEFHLGMDTSDLPPNLELACGDILNEVGSVYRGDVETRDAFIEALLTEYHI